MEIAELFFTISSQGLNNVTSQITKLGNSLTNVGSQITMVGNVLTNNVTKPILGLLGTSLELASDLNESFNVINVTFGKNADDVKAWAKTLIESFGLTELEATTYVGSMGAMLKSSGLSTKAAQDMSMSLVELTGDMSSFYNLSHEETWEKIRAGISGETEPLKALGINMTVANLEAYALSKGINKAWNEMSQAEQVTLRYNYLMEAAADAQGDFNRTADSFANKVRTIQGKLETFGVAIGNIILPYIESFLLKIEVLVNWLNNLDSATQRNIVVFSLIAAIIPPLIVTFGLLVTIVGTSITGFMTLAGILTTILSPVNLLLGGLALLTVGIGAAYLKTVDWKTVMANTKTFIMDSFVPALQYLATGEGLEKVNNAGVITKTRLQNIRTAMLNIKTFINESLVPALQYLATGEGLEKVQGASKNTTSKLKDLRSAIEDVRDWVKNLITKSKELVTELKDNSQPVIQSTKELFNELWKMVKKLRDMFKQLQSKTDSADDSLNDIKSTSKSTNETISDLAEGVSVLIDGFTTLARWAGNVADAIKAIDTWGKNASNTMIELQNKIPGGSAINDLFSKIGLASGTRYAKGGLTMVGEQGAELVNLPTGTTVYNNDETNRILGRKGTTTTTTDTITTENTYISGININIDTQNLQDINNIIDLFKNLKTQYVVQGGV